MISEMAQSVIEATVPPTMTSAELFVVQVKGFAIVRRDHFFLPLPFACLFR
jgi:hypothetical protein